MSEKNRKLNFERITKFVTIGLGLTWFELLGEIWKLGKKIMRGHSNEGMYEVLEYETTLEILDGKGKNAIVNKIQKVRYLQDNIIVYQDQAWGDGEILIDYKCSPGIPVDRYQIGYKTVILISLRKVQDKGKIDKFNIQWGIKDGFITKNESWGTSIDHRTKKLKVRIIFPKSIPPNKINLIECKRRRVLTLPEKAKSQLADGRWQILWETNKPKQFENYIIEWQW